MIIIRQGSDTGARPAAGAGGGDCPAVVSATPGHNSHSGIYRAPEYCDSRIIQSAALLIVSI